MPLWFWKKVQTMPWVGVESYAFTDNGNISILSGMAIYLDPKNDLTFKKVFGEHKHLCISLINSLLKFKGNEQIKEIEYETTELIPELNILKDSFVDVRCKDKEGREFIVEMQFYWSASFKSRVLFNASKAYVKQLGSGKNYNLLCPVYSLNLVNDIFEPERLSTQEINS